MKKAKNTRIVARVHNDIYDLLDDYSKENKITKSEIMTEALKKYILNGEIPEKDEEIITLDEMKNEISKINKRLGFIDKELQTIIEVTNSVLNKEGIVDANFVGSDDYENALLKNARDYVGERVRKRKQDRDFRKYK